MNVMLVLLLVEWLTKYAVVEAAEWHAARLCRISYSLEEKILPGVHLQTTVNHGE
jgi:hypothetical protein